jgi:hypothetical protein
VLAAAMPFEPQLIRMLWFPHQQKRGGAAPSYCQGRGGGAVVTLVAIWRYGMFAIGNIAIWRCHPAWKKKIGGYQCVRYASGWYSQDQKIDIVLVVDAHYGLSHAEIWKS